MRLWHWKLIPVLPRQQLLGQWRECCLIAKDIAENGTPNHILVNPVMEYPLEHFITYTRRVFDVMDSRDYNVHSTVFTRHIDKPFCEWLRMELLFPGWHNDDYLKQCYYNLQEKHDRGGITDEEWQRIEQYIRETCYIRNN